MCLDVLIFLSLNLGYEIFEVSWLAYLNENTPAENLNLSTLDQNARDQNIKAIGGKIYN